MNIFEVVISDGDHLHRVTGIPQCEVIVLITIAIKLGLRPFVVVLN